MLVIEISGVAQLLNDCSDSALYQTRLIALESSCCSRVTHRGLRCGIDFGIPSLRPLRITLLLALSLGRWALSTSTETLNLNLSTFTNA